MRNIGAVLAWVACTVVSLALASTSASAAPGDLDPTFAFFGFTTDPAQLHGEVAIQPDAKIVAASASDPARRLLVLRKHPGGNPDFGWSGNGQTTTIVGGLPNAANGIALQPDDKVVVAVRTPTALALVRYETDGSLDPTFGIGGIVTTPILAGSVGRRLLLQPDGKIVAAGSFAGDFALVRHHPDGSIDLGFGGGGVAYFDVPGTTEVEAIALQPDGKIVAAGVVGGDVAVVRFFSSGVPDPGFGAAGLVMFEAGGPDPDVVNDLAIHVDGKIVLCGSDGTDGFGPGQAFLARLEIDGSLDAGFAGTGVLLTSFVSPTGFSTAGALVPQGDGKTILVGSLTEGIPVVDTFTARVDASGALDPSWGGTGLVINDFAPAVETATSAAIAAGKLVLAGGVFNLTGAHLLLARYEIGEFCGDGVVQPGEACDDGNFAGGCCSATCSFEPAGVTCEPDADACTADQCDGAGQCEHLAVPDGTACEDGSPCSIGESCTGGVCSGGDPSGDGCPNPLVCYNARPSRGTPRFQRVFGLSVDDLLESGSFDAKSPFELCLPARVNDVALQDPDVHQIAYKIKPSKGEPRHVPQTGIVVEDHFGVHTLDTKKAELLLVPAGLALDAPATAPTSGTAFHYKCYKVKQTKGTPPFAQTKITATDGFEDRFYDVYQPRRLCYAADKNDEGILDPNALLTCYRFRRAAGQAPHDRVEDSIHTADQFGDLRFDTKEVRDLCLPASLVP